MSCPILKIKLTVTDDHRVDFKVLHQDDGFTNWLREGEFAYRTELIDVSVSSIDSPQLSLRHNSQDQRLSGYIFLRGMDTSKDYAMCYWQLPDSEAASICMEHIREVLKQAVAQYNREITTRWTL